MSEKPKTPTPEQRQAADPKHSVWVAANAGSGKTQVLVDRVIRLLLDGADPQAILCLTFTKAAAAEMSNRLFQRLSHWIGLDDAALDSEILRLTATAATLQNKSLARTLFARALETPGGLKIQTIHAFCERLLQLFPVESGMAPGFRVLEGEDSKQLFNDALLASLSASNDQTWEFLSATGVNSLDALQDLAKPFLMGSSGMRQRLSDTTDLATLEAQLRMLLNVSVDATTVELKAEICHIDEAAYTRAVIGLLPLEADAQPSAPLVLQRALQATSADARIAAFVELVLTDKGTARKSIVRAPAKKQQPELATWLETERSRIVGLLEALALRQILDANLAIYRALAGVLARVNAAKRARGLYDFDDLIAKTANLLEGHAAAQWVLYKLDKGLTHILVDEAQDTSPAQWTIIKALAGEFFTEEQKHKYQTRTIFAVGDIKQSIFSFQGADIASFEAARTAFDAALKQVDDSLKVVDLAVSYRSSQQVLDSVDQVFARGSFARTGFGPRAEFERSHTAFHTKRLGLVELWDVIRPDESEPSDHWRAPVDKPANTHHRLKLAERVAATIQSWINSNRQLTGENRAVRAGDILILLQRRNVLFNALIGALRRKNVAVAGADRLVLQDSLIVKDLQALGQFIRMPQDDLALACVLKSPLVPLAFSDAQLFDIAYERGTSSLWQRLPETHPDHVMLKACLNHIGTPHMFFARVLQQAKTRILERLGAEADDAAQEFLNLALDYEQRDGTSLFGFLDWLAGGETEIKREMQAGSDQVRIMTVHAAKGLEASIVILADAADDPMSSKHKSLRVAGTGPSRGLHLFTPKTHMQPPIIDALKHAEKTASTQERMRLMYVGMTRAAHELYICGSHNKNKLNDESWYYNIDSALSQQGEKRDVADDPELTLWRWGPDPQIWPSPAAPARRPPDIPAWATTPITPRARPAAVNLASRNSDQFDRKAIAFGVATHRLLEVMADVAPILRLDLGLRLAKRLQLPADLVRRLHDTLHHQDLGPLFGEHGQSEVSLDGTLAGLGRINGRLDRLAITPEAIYLLDYKTNQHTPSHVGPSHPYARQMARYSALLALAYPALPIKAALLWTQSGQLMWLEPLLLSQSLAEQRQSQGLTPSLVITTS
jgi:ATP-dependent helicase/nuclease subunit A